MNTQVYELETTETVLSPLEESIFAGVFLAIHLILPPIVIICGVVGNTKNT
jgi:hypothetical protein